MCGILFLLTRNEERAKTIESSLLPLLNNRGPDAQCLHSTSCIAIDDLSIALRFHGSVLHLRGDLTRQPLLDEEEGHTFLWNGEVFGGNVNVSDKENDTDIIFKRLKSFDFKNVNDTEDHYGYTNEMVELFSGIQGPWAFVFYDAVNQLLWYGRDFFGRRSLLSNFQDGTFCVSSIGHRKFGEEFTEVPAKMLYCLNMKTLFSQSLETCLQTFPLVPVVLKPSHDITSNATPLVQHRCLLSPDGGLNIDHDENNQHANEKVLCCQCLIYNQSQFSSKEKFKCQNVDGCSSSTTATCVDSGQVKVNPPCMSLVDCMHQFLHVLENSVHKRVFNIPRTHLTDESCNEEKDASRSKVGILFSGGIDSVVLTALADRCTPPHESIDLINVAFAQKPKIEQNFKKKYQKPVNGGGTLNFDVPDRITGREALKDLSKKRTWNFIEVNVTLDELQKKRESDVTHLVHPLTSVLDDSIGCAIWFAAKGTGTRYIVQSDASLQLVEEKYTSPVKVLICGMGADEQLGGYARHRTKFECSGWVGLQTEMEMEVERISSRNLGRDDRCISDHGREARFPFLDEDVVSFLRNLPVCVKCDPRLPRGIGEKILLRELATWIGLPYVSRLPKRAIQFGSRIAKLESTKEKASDTCKRLERIEIT